MPQGGCGHGARRCGAPTRRSRIVERQDAVVEILRRGLFGIIRHFFLEIVRGVGKRMFVGVVGWA